MIKTLLIKLAKVTLPFVLGAGILWWMYRGCDWDAFRRMLTHDLHWGWMLFSLVFGIVPQVLRGLRWRMALDPVGEHPHRRVCVDAIFLSYAASLVIPRVGEVTRCGTLKQRCGTSFTKSLGTVVTERIVDSILLLMLSAAAFAAELPQMVRFMRETGMHPSALYSRFTAAGYWVTALCLLLLVLLALHLLWKMKAFERGRQFVLDLLSGVASLAHVEHLWLYLIMSLGIWVGYYLHFYIAFFAFDFTAHLSPISALLIFCIGSFAVIVPTPNGAGPWHFAVKTMLVLMGVAEQPAVLFALAVHTIQTALVVLLGAYGLMDLSLISRQK